jgi:hypothetical protein
MNILNQTHFDRGSRWVQTKTRNAWANGPKIAADRARGIKVKDLLEAYNISYPTLRRIIKAQDEAPSARPVPSDREVELQGHIDAMRKERAEMVRKHKAELEAAAQKQAAAAQDLAAAGARSAEYELLAEQNNDQLQKDLARAQDEILSLYREIQVLKGLHHSDLSWQKEASDEYQRRVTAEADRKAAEAQLEMMAERLSEIRNRGFWARVFG